MESGENFNAAGMPSRTILLTGIPPDLNTTEKLYAHFGTFGVLLNVNEKYDENPGSAIVTFFSISDAISAFISTEPILGVDTIQMSWSQYTKQCEFCSYKYSTDESIKQHVLSHHTSKEEANDSVKIVAEPISVAVNKNQEATIVEKSLKKEIELLRIANRSIENALEGKP